MPFCLTRPDRLQEKDCDVLENFYNPIFQLMEEAEDVTLPDKHQDISEESIQAAYYHSANHLKNGIVTSGRARQRVWLRGK